GRTAPDEEPDTAASEALLPVLFLQRLQRFGIVVRSQLALGDELLLQHRLLLVLCAFLHQPPDRPVAPVLFGAGLDHLVLLGQALLTLGFRCIELADPGFAVVVAWSCSGTACNRLVLAGLRMGRGCRSDESEN